jgi:diguanylate cyclase (GGDEF)-like protein/PAS domain S-box-containing protein
VGIEAMRKLDHLGIAEGLSQSWVYCILQDRHGFLWFGTDNGLDRYDGYEMRHYKHRGGDRGSLADSKVYSLLEDREGRLWVGTVAGGLDRLDPVRGVFEHYAADPADPTALSDPFVSTLLEDRSGRLWVGTYRGLDRFDEETGTFEHFRHDPEVPGSLADDRVRVLFQDSRGRLWVGSEGGLDEIDPATGRVRRHRHVPTAAVPGGSAAVKALAEDPRGWLWVGTRLGLYRYDPQTGTAPQREGLPDVPAGLGEVHVWDLLLHEGDLWVATHERGLARMDLESGDVEWFRHDPLNLDSLSHDRVKSLHADRGGLVWIGTMGGGVNTWNPHTAAFVAYRHPPRETGVRERNEVQAILAEPTGRLWVGSAAGLERFDRRTSRGDFLPIVGGVEALAWDATGAILVASPTTISRVESESLAVEPFAATGGSTLLVDSLRRVWAGDAEGLRRYQSGGRLEASYHHDPEDPRSLPHDEVLSLVEDGAGTVWVGTRDGVGRYSEEDGAFDVFAAFHDPSGHDGVVSIYSPRPELLWLATENAGAIRLEVEGDRESLERFTTQEGLLNDNTASVLGDEEGRIWIGSVEGLTRYEPERGETKHYTVADGLHGGALHAGAAFRATDGELFFGGVGGLTAFRPELLEDNLRPPPIVVTSVTRGNERLPILGAAQPELEIAYSARMVSIEYTALDYSRPLKNRYRHRLLGSEEAWTDVGTTREVTYAGLRPGHYVFQVAGSNSDGVWSTEPASLELVVAPPAWRSAWAWLAYGLALCFVVGTVALARSRKLAERRRYQDQLRLFAKAFESASEGMVITAADGTILEVNRGLEAITGYREAEIVGEPSNLLDSTRHPPQFYQKLWERLRETGQWQGELWQRRKSGEDFPAYLTASALFDDEGRLTHFVAVLSDITERKRNEEELRRLANFDLLTQLPNRTLFEDRLQHAVAGAKRDDERLALLFIDLDRFKQVNDSLGHGAGDLLLQEVATRLRQRIRASDTVARLGGDEFTVILEGIQSIQEVVAVAGDVIAALSRPYCVDGLEINVTPSLGICLYPEGGATTAELMRHADTAMYQAKGDGGNTYRLYHEEMDAQVGRRLRTENELRRALDQGELRLHFQPRVDLDTGAVRSVEALVRWAHPERGLLLPDRFIGIAEESGLILPLGEWVLESACRQAHLWSEEGSDVRVAVNLSARQFRRGELAESVARILADTGLPGERLELEITETTIMADLPLAREALQRLKKLGVYISVDDFGTGYSSLSYLKIFPLDALKIDRSFVRDLGRDPQDEAIVTAITTLAKSLDLAVTGEGVETLEQLRFLRQVGCDEVQGFLVGRPQPASELAEVLQRGFVHLDHLATAEGRAVERQTD